MSQKAIRKSYYSTVSLASVVGRLGEFSVDITKHTIVIYDGTTAGGFPLALETHSHSLASGSQSGFMASADYTYLYNHVHPNVTTSNDGFMSAADKLKLDGINGGGGTPIPYTPNSTADTIVSRDVNADFAGRFVTATKFIGALQGNADTATNGVVTSGSYSNPAWITALAGSKVTAIPDASIAAVGWSKLTGTAPNISTFPNNSGFINGSGNTTGTAGGVQSLGGRETSSPTARTVILRDVAGRAQVVSPSANADIATKQYVDANAGFFAYRMATIVSTSVAGNSPFNFNALNVSSEMGSVWRLSIHMPVDISFSTIGWTNTTISITIDGTTTFSTTMDNFVIFGDYPYRTSNVNPYLFTMNLSYKQSCLINLTNPSPGFTSGTVDVKIIRYVVIP